MLVVLLAQTVVWEPALVARRLRRLWLTFPRLHYDLERRLRRAFAEAATGLWPCREMPPWDAAATGAAALAAALAADLAGRLPATAPVVLLNVAHAENLTGLADLHDRAGVLADALEDAGCTDALWLATLRGLAAPCPACCPAPSGRTILRPAGSSPLCADCLGVGRVRVPCRGHWAVDRAAGVDRSWGGVGDYEYDPGADVVETLT